MAKGMKKAVVPKKSPRNSKKVQKATTTKKRRANTVKVTVKKTTVTTKTKKHVSIFSKTPPPDKFPKVLVMKTGAELKAKWNQIGYDSVVYKYDQSLDDGKGAWEHRHEAQERFELHGWPFHVLVFPGHHGFTRIAVLRWQARVHFAIVEREDVTGGHEASVELACRGNTGEGLDDFIVRTRKYS